MAQAIPKLITFEEFIDWYPNTGIRYELRDGVIVKMPPPAGKHEKFVGFIARKLTVEFDRVDLPFTIPKTAFVKPESADSAYSPDVLLLNLDNLDNEPLWNKESTVSQPASIPLLVEVVSTALATTEGTSLSRTLRVNGFNTLLMPGNPSTASVSPQRSALLTGAMIITRS